MTEEVIPPALLAIDIVEESQDDGDWEWKEQCKRHQKHGKRKETRCTEVKQVEGAAFEGKTRSISVGCFPSQCDAIWSRILEIVIYSVEKTWKLSQRRAEHNNCVIELAS
jgi:hypothetical protein